ncbi:MAG: glycogen/starch synthase [Candidatus Eiseniibacteriota bacterium]|jgi:glycogen synthase
MRSTAQRTAAGRLFSGAELERLATARRRVDAATATIVYAVYENPFARGGGIYAVADNYSAALVAHGREVVVVSPCHARLRTAPSPGQVTAVGACAVPFGTSTVPVRLLEHRRAGVRWILLEADPIFDAGGGPSGTDPYVHGSTEALLQASLFACAALPHALAVLGLGRNVIVHAQDWEMASAALTVKEALVDGTLESAAVVLTSHNPYDCALTERARTLVSRRLGARTAGDVHTVYQQMIELTDAPLSTVSRNFAHELLADPLQTGHFADHLQAVLARHGIVGVDNGLFGRPEPAFSAASIEAARAGEPAAILAEKRSRRRTMLDTLADYEDPRTLGRLAGQDGDASVSTLPDAVPVFLMFGRLDPGQKGFDVLARVIAGLAPGSARFILTPIAGGAPPPYLAELERLAETRRGDVVVYPFRMERGYMEAMAGATFAVMPSLYEPFGGATEPYLAGTPVVARATGGLVQQVVDLDDDAAGATGLLFREALGCDDAAAHGGEAATDVDGSIGSGGLRAPPVDLAAQWRQIQLAREPGRRHGIPLYEAMVGALAQALERACHVVRDDPASYGRMLANLHARATAFSWDSTIAGYQRLYEQATR